MYKTTNIPVPSVMTSKGLRYPNVPGGKDSINSLEDFLRIGRGIALYIDGPKYDPMENILKSRVLQNMLMGDKTRAQSELNGIFASLYKCKNDTREVSLEIRMAESDERRLELEEEKRQLENESWPSIAIDIASWWAKYVDESTGRDKITQIERDYDPQNLAMSESLLRRYIKGVLT